MLRFAFLLLLLLPASAHAELSGAALSHAKSAFRFADKNDWKDARLHARESGSETLVKVITLEYCLDPDSGASFDEITRFIKKNPDWPEQKKLRLRAEQSLKGSQVSDSDIIRWFSNTSPITGIGKLALAEALMRKGGAPKSRIDGLIHEAWRGGDFDEKQEKVFFKKYHHLLTKEDNIERVSRLLWEEKVTPAKRMLSEVPGDWRRLFKARIALIQNKRWAGIAIAEVPRALKADPGLLFDRLRYREQRGFDSGVREVLLEAPPVVPYPDRWWRWRETEIIKAVDERNYRLAERLLANHGQVDGASLADAVWLSGWIKTEFLHRPKEGYDIFQRMYDTVHYPVSKARAAYWAGRAAERTGDKATAARWYAIANNYPTTFYGQLASLKQSGNASLHIPPMPAIRSDEREAFDAGELARAIKICAEAGEDDLATRLIEYMAENADNVKEAALVADFGSRVGSNFLGVRAAKKAMQVDVLDMRASYPQPETPRGLAVERPLALAIGRQESEFDPRAKSPSDALGIMQLKPSTAHETARKNGLGYSKSRLFEAGYSFQVGSLYLSHLIHNYDGSYLMAIAAYNAGPGNVKGWVEQFGRPGSDVDGAVNWIEKIPYGETRNYVQRVIENLQVYRYLEAGGRSELRLDKDLVR